MCYFYTRCTLHIYIIQFMQCNLITEYCKMCAQRTILSVCRSCERYFSTSPVSQSSRYLKGQTAVNRAAMTVKQLDIGVERELKRIERLRKKKEKKDVLQSFYARSAVINKKFISDVAQVLKGYPELRGLGMVVTKTKVDVNFTTLKVYWSSGKIEQGNLGYLCFFMPKEVIFRLPFFSYL